MIGYGKFIQTLIDFVIIAYAIFLAVKFINSLKKKEELLLTEIRDLMKEGK